MKAHESCQFIPSYLVEKLAGVEDETLSQCGRVTQRLDTSLAARRETRPSGLAAAGADEDGTKVIYTADNTEQLPGTRARGDDEAPTGDDAVDEAYDSAGQVHELFASSFDRDSMDGAGGTLTVTVHYGQNYDNAFWDGQQLVFGDGDGTVFGRFTKPADVMYHEFTHGVTQFTAGLTYKGQSGALNESVSDCFASMAKQKVNEQSAGEADWLIGEGIFQPGVQGKALRSMKDPGTAYDDPKLGKDPQVGSMSEYVDTDEDNGGVHINSGIPNRAFYLVATGIGGNSWEAPGRIWYATLTGGDVTADTDFAGFARATTSAARSLFGDDSAELEAVRAAWKQVGVGLRSGPASDGSASKPTGTLVVRRTGGVAGAVREESLDLASSTLAGEISELLGSAGATPPSAPQPDRFSYTFDVSGRRVTIAEPDLTPELGQLVAKVFDA